MATLAVAVGAGGCGKQSILTTRSKPAHDIALLWWWMLAAATVVFLGAVALLVIGWWRRDRPGLPFFGEREDLSQGMVLVFGIAVPLVALVALFGVSDVYLVGQTAPPSPRSTKMTIDVIGHQWWWEVRYDGGRIITANEIHIPVATRVNVVATTADVIHSFWVPALNRKIDMIPGLRNRVLLYASKPGEYRGQCSQFCGVQHANMALEVFAQRPAAFHAWLSRPAATGAAADRGPGGRRAHLVHELPVRELSHHRGHSGAGHGGAHLTHVASRTTLAANEIPNTPRWLAAWIRNPQKIKPGDRMPDLGLGWPRLLIWWPI